MTDDDCLDAVCRAGTALQLVEQIRDSTPPGTTLHAAAAKAARDILDLIDELVVLYAGTPPAVSPLQGEDDWRWPLPK